MDEVNETYIVNLYHLFRRNIPDVLNPYWESKQKAEQKEAIFVRATGIVRRIDELGRVVIPKEIRRTLRIREGDPQQTALEGDAQEDAQMLLALLAGVIEQRKKYA